MFLGRLNFLSEVIYLPIGGRGDLFFEDLTLMPRSLCSFKLHRANVCAISIFDAFFHFGFLVRIDPILILNSFDLNYIELYSMSGCSQQTSHRVVICRVILLRLKSGLDIMLMPVV